MPALLSQQYPLVDCTPALLGLFFMLLMTGIAVFGLGYFAAKWLIERVTKLLK